MRSQADVSDTFLYDVVRHRLTPPYLTMLAQLDASGTNAALGTYQGMKRWLEDFERVQSVSVELQGTYGAQEE